MVDVEEKMSFISTEQRQTQKKGTKMMCTTTSGSTKTETPNPGRENKDHNDEHQNKCLSLPVRHHTLCMGVEAKSVINKRSKVANLHLVTQIDY